MNENLLSVVSVDVICLSYDRETQQVRLGLIRRDHEPAAGELALPGVVMIAGERLDGAAHRAIAKLTAEMPLALGQLRTFDEPSRDPRGPSLSIAMWAILPNLDNAIALEDAPPLAFDHSQILQNCLPMLGKLMLDDLVFTRAILPAPFLTTDARAIVRALSGEDPHMGNLNRALDALPGVVKASSAPSVESSAPSQDAAYPADAELLTPMTAARASVAPASASPTATSARRSTSRGRPPVERIFIPDHN